MAEVEKQHVQQVKEVAWDFLEDRLWDEAEWIEESLAGEEIWSVTFEGEGHVVTGTPTMLVEPNKKEVIGLSLVNKIFCSKISGGG